MFYFYGRFMFYPNSEQKCLKYSFTRGKNLAHWIKGDPFLETISSNKIFVWTQEHEDSGTLCNNFCLKNVCFPEVEIKREKGPICLPKQYLFLFFF